MNFLKWLVLNAIFMGLLVLAALGSAGAYATVWGFTILLGVIFWIALFGDIEKMRAMEAKNTTWRPPNWLDTMYDGIVLGVCFWNNWWLLSVFYMVMMIGQAAIKARIANK